MEVTDFLNKIGLGQYAKAFALQGYDDLSVLHHLSADDLADPELGMLPGHRHKLMLNLQKLASGEPLMLASETLKATLKNGFPTLSGESPTKDRRQGPLSETARTVDSDELQHVRNVVKRRGGDGINGLSRIFKQWDENGNGTLAKAEFITGLQNFGVMLSKEQFNRLFAQFDRNGDDTVSFTEFLRTVAGPLNKKRRAIVENAFHMLDTEGHGVLALDSLVRLYNINLNPDVQSGHKTAQTVISDFLHSFASNDVTLEDFCGYYSNLSCGIASDEKFEQVVRNNWASS
eukprot:comp19866_c0_seq1/m.38541 comp19866_c0_seq1/g.38541  ORF comp19866_c0_seq1/g.38541 comp19866_c0_seq1/m.38541 type:complete len:289 (+) comp19866_c0_seq1:132-998(+)